MIIEKNEADKRAYILNLTQKGKDAFLLSHNLFEQWDNKIMKDMDKEDREQLISLFKKLEPWLNLKTTEFHLLGYKQISRDDLEQDCLKLYLQTKLKEIEIQNLLRPVFQQKIRVIPEFEVINSQEMKALQFKNNSRKPLKIQDLRIETTI